MAFNMFFITGNKIHRPGIAHLLTYKVERFFFVNLTVLEERWTTFMYDSVFQKTLIMRVRGRLKLESTCTLLV